MKNLKLIVIILLAASACKKENSMPRLSFSAEERKWFIYQVGQEFKFKSTDGDSVSYVVDSVTDYFFKEHKYPDSSTVIDEAETYIAHLTVQAITKQNK